MARRRGKRKSRARRASRKNARRTVPAGQDKSRFASDDRLEALRQRGRDLLEKMEEIISELGETPWLNLLDKEVLLDGRALAALGQAVESLPFGELREMVDILQQWVDSAMHLLDQPQRDSESQYRDECEDCPKRATPACPRCDEEGETNFPQPFSQEPDSAMDHGSPVRIRLVREGGHRQRQGCLPPFHTDEKGRPQPDPWKVLGLEPALDTFDRRLVRETWRRMTIEHPPEADPQGALRLREARDRLIDPRQVVARELNVLHVPDPRALGLPSMDRHASSVDLMPSRDRLAALLFLYAMVEDSLLAEERRPGEASAGGTSRTAGSTGQEKLGGSEDQDAESEPEQQRNVQQALPF